MEYMATRPRAEHLGRHGLFTVAGEPGKFLRWQKSWTTTVACVDLDLPFAGRTPSGLVLTPLLAEAGLVRSQAGKLAQGLKIAPNHLKWYAAFHNEGHHPSCASYRLFHQTGRGVPTKQGMKRICSALAQEIFAQDLVSVYERQTAHRNKLRWVSREKIAALVGQINQGVCDNPQVELLLRELARQLSKVKGKRVYGYLRPELKALVNQIVDELAKEEHIARLYDLWYQDKQAARNVYDERPIERSPLFQTRTSSQLRNAVIQGGSGAGKGTAAGTASHLHSRPPAHGHPADAAGGANFGNQFQIDLPVARLTDSKLRQKIAEKKQAFGQKFSM